ncbi:MAG: type VI secretion system baseplate subunit TssF, partial [Bacteroidota bacterium]
MTNIKEQSTENIRSRMIKNAARVWGVEGDDIESTFDPLVTMMIEACAYELTKVNNEIVDSQSRILERLAQVLSPDTFTGAQPGYAIAHVRAAEPESTLRREVQMYAQQKTISQDQKEIMNDIYFSPANRATVFDAGVKYMAVGRSIYEFKSPSSKQLITDGKSGDALEPFHVWIGIDVNPKIKTLNNFAFYFDWKNDPEKDNYLNLLPLTKWFFNNAELKCVNGIRQD